MDKYEKKYKEALEKAKEILEMTSDKSAIYTIFPELAESKDERIRKEIKTYLENILSDEGYEDEDIENWIAWLEKQGEQKFTWSEEDEKKAKDIIFLLDQLDEQSKDDKYPKELIVWVKSIKHRIHSK